ncbi:hypothetical protein ABH908_006209 [Pseudomonas frederiksbergensis]|jgi:hypothetical protein|uniref:XAC2610-related protein n=1 Tax=Pseudomonas TaxID=286 RepID=UPI000DACC63E|nr:MULTISPECIES: hypothetical protein [unclassified Pseudomonas]MBD9619995.1 hypothetical protein [Pseudomonas sp. PDM07]PZW66549.1 hypothetical protein F475_00457 [Pseudomonas sp. URMO17WK12:I6]QDV92818.1 hypothetical protein FFH90_000265 [Pseudomonas sp. ATCC 43928]CAH0147127.1 hypothetical protein SRABI130_00686 [Pseudomonas sp. Bi130]
MRFKLLSGLLLGLLWMVSAHAEVTTFSPTQGAEVTLTLEGSSLALSVTNDGHSESRTITFEAESELRVQIDDFNFDGVKDFAIWQVDDGMSTYNIHRIFVYQPKTGTFQELQPDCGDGFVNLRVDGKRKALISTYWEMNVPKQCTTRFAKRKA